MPEWSSRSHNVRLADSCTVAHKSVEMPSVSTAEVLIGHDNKSDAVRYHTDMGAHGVKSYPLQEIQQRTSSEVDFSRGGSDFVSNGDSLPPPKRSVIVRPLVTPPGSPHVLSPWKTCGELL